jgi:predicted lipase
MSLAALVLCVALVSSLAAENHTNTSVVYNEARAKTFLYFSSAAYCNSTTVADWKTCKPCQLADPTFTPKIFQSNRTSGNVQVFVGVTHGESPESIVVAFRGSANLANWIYDFDFPQVDAYPKCDGCMVHRGFYAAWRALEAEVVGEVKRLVALKPNAQVFTTGHSLGAALAVLCAAELGASAHSLGVPIEGVYTFGLPRVGNGKFVEFYNSGTKVTWRVTHHRDPVPHAPLQAMGFAHTATEVFYNEDSSRYRVCDWSGEDPECSNRFVLPFDGDDHTHYLGLPVSEMC